MRFFGEEVDQYDSSLPKRGRATAYEFLDKYYKRHTNLDGQARLTMNAPDGTIMQRMYGEG